MKKYTYLITSIFLVFGVLFTGCDSNSTGTNPQTINGTWETTENEMFYLSINLPSMTTYGKPEVDETRDCFVIDKFSINRISGDRYKIKNLESGETGTATIRIENDVLTVTEKNNVNTFRRSNADVTQFEKCN